MKMNLNLLNVSATKIKENSMSEKIYKDHTRSS